MKAKPPKEAPVTFPNTWWARFINKLTKKKKA